MRKWFMFFSMLIFVAGMAACTDVVQPDPTDDTPIPTDDTPTPTDDSPITTNEPDVAGLYGVDDVTFTVGQAFDPYEGVVALDDDGNDVTDAIEILGLEQLALDEGRLTTVGEFVILYVIDIDDVRYEESRAIFVEAAEAPDDDFLADCQNPVINGWVISWCDEFTGEGDNLNANGVDLDRWGFQTGTGAQYGLTGWGNEEAQFYLEDNARVEDGRLIIEARRESHGGMQYTSARLYTKPTFSQTYGRFEAKIRLPIGEGLWPAFWMMPQDDVYGGWAASGEIDIMEARGRLPYQSIAALHFGAAWPDNVHTHEVYHFPAGQSINDFNVYAIEWEEGVIRWYVNDVLVKTSIWWYTQGHDFPAPFDQDFYLLLNLAIGGTFDGGRLPPNSLFDEPVIMEVEYVRVYQRSED